MSPMTKPTSQLETPIGITPAYWTHKIGKDTGPVAEFRQAQLVDFDPRLTEPARIVFRFIVGWYMEDRGNALASVRHIVSTMRSRVPDGTIPSRSAVQRALTLLLETGWLARIFTGTGRSASRYVPAANALALASSGQFPTSVPLHRDTTVASHSTGTALSHSTGTQSYTASQPIGTKTRLPDPRKDAGTGSSTGEVSATSAALGLPAAPADAGFERVWRAYGKLGNKVASRLAYAAIDDPDVSHIASRANAWAASAKAGQKRMPLEKWLAAEKYDEVDRRTVTSPRRSSGSVRRDVTVVKMAPTESGANLHVEFNDCEPGDVRTATQAMSMAELASLELATGVGGRNLCGARVLMHVDENDYLTFQRYQASAA